MAENDSFNTWQDKCYKPTTQKYPERKTEFKTSSDITVPPVVGPEKVHPNRMSELGYPGEYPFVRGVQPTMYRGKLWTMRQYAGYGDAA